MTHKNMLGMFVHFGPYAKLGIHEQALARLRLDHKEYEEMALSWNPENYNPDEWVALAKAVGMKYITFTAKHHDGFCMWDTKTTDYSIMHTPYGKDVLGMLADACHRAGMKFSIYYSNPDWHHPDAYNPLSSHQWGAVRTEGGDFEKYKEYIKAQITELLTNYGEIYSLFWDIPPCIHDASFNELVRSLQPDIYINDRGFDKGDFSTPERDMDKIEGGRFSRMTEACNAVGAHSWGYRKNEDYHTVRYLTSAIDRIMAMGGSYLLNVGPMPDGTIDEKSRERLLRVGEFYQRMGGILEENAGEAYDIVSFTRPVVINRKGDATYLHYYQGIDQNAVFLTKFPSLPKSVRLVNSDTPLPFEVDFLPECRGEQVYFEGEHLRIHDIDADALVGEPIVIEIKF